MRELRVEEFAWPVEPDQDLDETVSPMQAVGAGASGIQGFQKIEKVAGPKAATIYAIAGCCFLISALFKVMKAYKASAIAQKLIKAAGDPVDSAAYIKSHLKAKEPVLVVHTGKDLKAVREEIKKAGVGRVMSVMYPQVISSMLTTLRKGENAFAMPVKGKNYNFFVIGINKKAPRLVLAHELGHVKSCLQGDSAISFNSSFFGKVLGGFLESLSASYDKYGKYGTSREEIRAWDLAGVPEDNELRKVALASYWQHGEARRGWAKMTMFLKAAPFLVGFAMLAKKKWDAKHGASDGTALTIPEWVVDEEGWYQYYMLEEEFGYLED